MTNVRQQSLSQVILWTLVLALPWYQLRWNVVGIPTTALEAIVILCAFLSLALPTNKSFLQRIRIFFTIEQRTLRRAILLFLFTTTLAAWAVNTPAAAGIWKAYVVDALIAGLTVQMVSRWQDNVLRTIISAGAALLLIVGTVAIFQWLMPSGLLIGGYSYFAINDADWRMLPLFRATSLYDYPNAIGLLAAPLVVLIAGAIIEFGGTALLLSGFASGVLAIVLAHSNGAMLAVVVALLSGYVLKKLSPPKKVWAVTVALLIWVLLPFLPLGPIIEESLRTNPSGVLRIEQHTETRKLLSNSPLWGGGLANYQQSITPYHNTETSGPALLYPHNMVLALWSEFGLLGMIATLGLILLTLRHLAGRTDLQAQILLSVWVALLVHGLVDVPYFKNDLAVIFWIILVLSWANLKAGRLDRDRGYPGSQLDRSH